MRDNHRFRLDVWGSITLVILAIYLLFMVYPLGNLIKMAFYGDEGFTLDHFIKFFSKPYYSSTLVNSFKVSFWATVTSLLVGVPMAYFFALYKIRGKQTLRILIIISSMSAPFVGAYAWILLLGRNGVVTNFFKTLFGITPPDIYGFNGMLLVFTTQLFSLIFLYVAGALSKVDNSLLEASENMGCTGVRRFFKVVLPLITPTLLAGALLVFIRALSDFGTPMLMGEGYRTFPVILYTEFVGEVSQNKGFASAIAVIAIVITTVVFFAQNIASKRNSFSMNSLHPIEEKPLRGIKGVLIHAFCYVVVFIAILPQLYVLYTSFKKTSGTIYVDGYSLDSYREMFSRLGRSVQNTIVIPVIALVAVILLAILMAYLSVRRRNVLSSTVDVLSMVPYIIPGTVVGIALVTSFNRPPVAFTGTMFIMVAALIIRRLPYTIRSSVAILHQIPITIEEAALSLGSTKMKTFFKITVPMMSSGIVAGAILSWVTMISELSTAMILYTGRTQTLTVAIYTQIVRGNYGIAAAMASVLTILTIISLLIFNKLSKNGDITM
ncbi:iron ABC transporter permease [Oscillibacter sp.]|jgi:iron(III) transport system permease protein|uniref:ABC transporter permease n=1 Tax=Oscillibacter sp. TaxID=1945593 RepID=UPI0021726B42|nr:iron ABC transporter permease [Oscillibacter sp.]MCI9648303.1 iron ABC transporter permease [Oscillibacter sp.]